MCVLKMAISYSAITNYGKITLPSVEAWGTNNNIKHDPPRSIHTRKIDKVGQTSSITTQIDDSGDRFCENINYYARGQNPMVSVSFGQGQQGQQSYLPYRVAREGAFRPPIWRQEDLLPLSRMPRVWTEVCSQPYAPIFTQRILNCGTAEETPQVKNNTLAVNCMSNKIINLDPDQNQPDVRASLLKDPFTASFQAPLSCNMSSVEITQRNNQGPILLAPTRPTTSGYSNKTFIKELPRWVDLKTLERSLPQAEAMTNKSAPFNHQPHASPFFARLVPRPHPGSMEGNVSIPRPTDYTNPTPMLKMK